MEEIIIKQKQGSFECDFEGAKKQITEQLDIYSRMVFTEETKKDAKNTVAELRKNKKAFETRVKEVKNEYMLPLNAFIAKASEVAELFDQPINYINEQIDAFEQKRIEEKREVCKSLYEELIPEEDLREFLPYDRIFNPKWENATFTEKQIREEMMTVKEEVKTAIVTIKQMGSEAEERALDFYKATKDLSKALLIITDYERQKKEIIAREQERIKREEEERIRREEREKIEAERRKAEEIERAKAEALMKYAEEVKEEVKEEAKEEAKAEIIEQLTPVDTEEELTSYQYTLFLNADAKDKVETFLNSIGIEFYVREL